MALTATVGNDTYTYTKTGVTFENGKYYAVSVKMSLKTLANATTDDIGKVVDINGKIINSTTGAAAMIAYISSPGHGLAIALSDDASDSFTDAGKNAAGHTPKVALGTWRMPSRTDWEHMFTACGISSDGETSAGNWTNKGFRDKLTACGADRADIQTNNPYWTGTDLGNGYASTVYFTTNNACSFQSASKSESLKVRAVLEF